MKRIINHRYAMYLICLFTIGFVLKLFYFKNIISLPLLIAISVSLNLAMILIIYIHRKKINNIYIIIGFIMFTLYNSINDFIFIYHPNNLIGDRISIILFILAGLSFYKASNTKSNKERK